MHSDELSLELNISKTYLYITIPHTNLHTGICIYMCMCSLKRKQPEMYFSNVKRCAGQFLSRYVYKNRWTVGTDTFIRHGDKIKRKKKFKEPQKSGCWYLKQQHGRKTTNHHTKISHIQKLIAIQHDQDTSMHAREHNYMHK